MTILLALIAATIIAAALIYLRHQWRDYKIHQAIVTEEQAREHARPLSSAVHLKAPEEPSVVPSNR